jgi:hypothetical protein
MNQLLSLNRIAVIFSILLISTSSHAQSNYAVSLDGTNDYVSTSAYVVPTSGNFTVELWVYAITYTGYQEFVSQGSAGSAFYIGITNTTGVIRCGDNWGSTGVTMPLNQWVHIALVKSGGSATLYLNGIQKATIASGYSISSAGTNFQMATQYGGFGEYFNGKIDEVRVWNTAKTQTEIKTNMFNKNLSNNASGLVAYYRMNNGSGTTATNSCTNTSGIDGTLTNGPTWTASPVQFSGNALSFDGTNDYVSIPDDNTLDITTNITLEAWVYATKNSGYQHVICKSSNSPNNGYIFPTTSDGWSTVSFYLHTSSGGWEYNCTASYGMLNAWHHLAATYDGATMKLYIDGVLATSKAKTGTITTNANPLTLGSQPGYGEYFGGSADDFRVWNVTRTQTEIQNNMNHELDPSLQTGLVSYYIVNQGNASGTNTGFTTLIDQKGNNNGTLTNFSLSGTSSNYVSQNSSLTLLPLKWISFTAQKQNDKLLLQWTTASEINTADFSIEYRTETSDWKSIGTVLSVNDGQDIHHYSYTHGSPVPGNNYYRIKQTDWDNKYSYSVIKSVRINDKMKSFVIINNPVANGRLQVQIKGSGNHQISLLSSDGKIIWSKEFASGKHSINAFQLHGVYFLTDGSHSEKFIAQ